ncbi:MAG: ribonuclease III [Verrucomicrobia bacterium]|nr:ribonuclease III [Verrucomicrobiota bacterium]
MHHLEGQLGYKFRKRSLLEEALTHPSVGHEKQRYHADNQRLEFLGDAVLQLVITEYLYAKFPQEQEGALTKLRARLVSREALKWQGQSLQLGEYLIMGRGEEASGGRTRSSAIADAFEAVVGAIYLDSDFATARRFIVEQMAEALAHVLERPVDVNPKGQLQEILQGISTRSPVYETISAVGPEHAKTFVVEARWEGNTLGRGTGQSKQAAEIAAALDALERKGWEKRARD